MIEPNDPNWDRLQATSKAAKDDPAAWLAMADIYGDVGNSAGRSPKPSPHALKTLWENGTRQTLTRYLCRQPLTSAGACRTIGAHAGDPQPLPDALRDSRCRAA